LRSHSSTALPATCAHTRSWCTGAGTGGRSTTTPTDRCAAVFAYPSTCCCSSRGNRKYTAGVRPFRYLQHQPVLWFRNDWFYFVPDRRGGLAVQGILRWTRAAGGSQHLQPLVLPPRHRQWALFSRTASASRGVRNIADPFLPPGIFVFIFLCRCRPILLRRDSMILRPVAHVAWASVSRSRDLLSLQDYVPIRVSGDESAITDPRPRPDRARAIFTASHTGRDRAPSST